MAKANQPEKRRRRTPRPLTAEQQALCIRNHARAMTLAVEEENKHTGANGYYAHGLDVTGVAEEMLVVAARGYDPEHERANFDGYLRRCIERGLVKEYRKNEKYI